MSEFQTADLSTEERLAAHQALLVWLEWQARHEREVIRHLKAEVATERHRREQARRGLGFTIEADRSGLGAVVHRGDCGLAKRTAEIVDAVAARDALAASGADKAPQPCQVCKPLSALRHLPPPANDPWASA